MSRKILIVDDDRDQHRALSLRLRSSGYEVAVAADGMQAVAAVRNFKPDLVLLDIGLPGGDGHTVLQRIKAMTTTSLVPVLVLSAMDPTQHRERALAEGAAVYLQKPPENAVLMGMIRSLLGETGGRAKAA